MDERGRLLALYDETLFGSAKEGFLLTYSGIYWTKGHYKSWDDIRQIRKKYGSDNCIMIDHLSINIVSDAHYIPDYINLLNELQRSGKKLYELSNSLENGNISEKSTKKAPPSLEFTKKAPPSLEFTKKTPPPL